MPGQVAQGEWRFNGRFFIDISWGNFFGFSGGLMGLLWEIYGDLMGFIGYLWRFNGVQ